MNDKSNEEANALSRLEDWYSGECNGDWEHSYGVTIETLDNPGWIVKVDLSETVWEGMEVPREVNQRSEHDWIQIEISKSQFIGCGGVRNLSEVIDAFLGLVGVRTPDY